MYVRTGKSIFLGKGTSYEEEEKRDSNVIVRGHGSFDNGRKTTGA